MMSKKTKSAPDSDPGAQSLAELFHLVSSVTPKGQELLTVTPNTTVAEAVSLMLQHNYSQLPVVEGNAVLGVFCFRSFAARLLEIGHGTDDVGSLPVDEFIEEFHFVQRTDTWESTLKHIDRDDAALVGHRDGFEAILTSMDVLAYLRAIANPFVMLAEIEMSLRNLIEGCVDQTQLEECVRRSLRSKYGTREVPEDLREMTLDDYGQVITNGQNWSQFSEAFGDSEWQRKNTAQRLKQVRELRNVVFHFRRKLTPEEQKLLDSTRKWLQTKTRAFQARKRSGDRDQIPKQPPPKHRWDKASFFQELEGRQGSQAIEVARKIYKWARIGPTRIAWGKGKQTGAFVPFLKHKGRRHQVCVVGTQGEVGVYFYRYRRKPPFDSADKRLELLGRLNAIAGLSLPEDVIDGHAGIRLVDLRDQASLEQLLKVFDWVIQEIRDS